jgi:hypothetical protein
MKKELAKAFFISPEGEVLPVKTSHIALVMENPGRFGLTEEKIRETYARHKEKMGLEGDARKEILVDIIRRGWIRLRRYTNQYWSINVPRWDETRKKYLRTWAGDLLQGRGRYYENDPYLPVKIRVQETGEVINGEMGEM